MGDILAYIVTLTLVCVASRGLILALTENANYTAVGVYSVRARRLGQRYKIAAWSILLLALISSLARISIQVFLTF
jgi:cobalamin synthase